MKRVLITGANSYIGSNVERWLLKEPENYFVEILDMKNPNWKSFDFSKYDVVFHVAGIAHVSQKRKMKDLYFRINRDLTIETAQIAKRSGVKQFIFMSSMIVYNSKDLHITINSKPNPDNFYGLSKLEAETGLMELNDASFNVSIIRSPFVYGPQSKGNFNKILKASRFFFILPLVNTKRSILYIDNLSIFIKYIIEKNMSGIFFPQNDIKVNVFQVILDIRKIQNKKTFAFKFLGFVLIKCVQIFTPLRKIIGDRYYDSTTEFHDKNELKFISYNETLLDILDWEVK